MTLDQQVELVNSIVKKDPDFTIKDYLELLTEIDGIEATIHIPYIRDIVTDYAQQIKKRNHYAAKRLPGKY